MSDLKYRRPAILDKIPLDQHAVIEASAGTGKTYTIENLVVELLLKTDATIDRILVVTFTEKATSELRARIRATLESVITGASATEASDENAATISADGIRKLREALFSFDRAPIQTIHSFCHRILSELAFQTGTRFEVEVTDALSSFHEAFRAELREHVAGDQRARSLLSEWLAKHSMQDLEEHLRNAHQKRYLLSGEPARNAQLSNVRRDALAIEVRVTDVLLPRIAARTESAKRERGLLDYDDMLAWLARALDEEGGAALASTLRDRYRYALIDEFQDTDELQWKIFRRIFVEAEKNFIHLIGDPKQAIYSFRGADVFTYLAARRELSARKATMVQLSENFRSTEKLIEAVNSILRQDAPRPFFSGEIRYDSAVTCGRKTLPATGHKSDTFKPVTLLKLNPAAAMTAPGAREAIGAQIAATIGKMLDGSAPLRVRTRNGELKSVTAKDIFILTRSNPESVAIGKHLREVGVPFAFYKQEGLFGTREASEILDALKGVQEPEIRSCRFKAWTTPFFAVPYASLAKMADLPPSHPLLERLYEWKALADQERFAELFEAILHQSGLVNRELFLSSSGRGLTNYLHIFEILIEKAGARRLALAELIELLGDYISGRALPGGDDSDVLRIESERDAVQIMTVHKSKGLEAEVVFLFGGTHRGNPGGDVAVFHERGERRVAIGKLARAEVKDTLQREEAEEDQRLMYVALTRARSKLYLPYFPDKSIRKINGFYKHLNDRLKFLAEPLETGRETSELFEINTLRDSESSLSACGGSLEAALHDWNPPESLLDDAHDDDARKIISAIAPRHAPLKVWSYTSLQHARDAADPFDLEEFRSAMDSIEATTGTADLPGGRSVGVFLHEVIEKLDFESFGDAPDLKSWVARKDVYDLFASVVRRYAVVDPRWMVRGPEIVFNALTSRVALGETLLENGLCRLPNVREMEFAYPIPERHHRRLGDAGNGAWTVERGYVKGFIDLVFQRDNLVYFADWKGDLLPSYDPAAVTAHVERHYGLQAVIYALGVVRLLGIRSERDYESRFGGLLYVFLRGVLPTGDGKSGFYFARPSWSEIVSYESELMTTQIDSGSHI